VSALGVGLAALGRPAYITEGRDVDFGDRRDIATMERRCHEMLDAAWAAGIRYVDVARSYGRAEEFLATWLRARNLEPGSLTIASKWGYRYVGGWQLSAPVHEVKDHSVGMFRGQLAETRALLGSHLGLYQVHSATLDSGVLEDREVLEALVALARSGTAVGLTVSGAHQADTVRRALEVDVDGTNPFSAVQATWNVLETSVGAALAQAHDQGWGVVVKEALANGRLTDRGNATHLGALRQEADRRCAGVEEIALATAFAQPWADVVLSGAVLPTQLDVDCASLSLVLSGEERQGLEQLAEDPAHYWRARAELPWH
jgi:aryl-alcohol dehydrogenase-like predicted oxidoreductase